MQSLQNMGFHLTLRELCGKTSQVHSQVGTKMESSLFHGLTLAEGSPPKEYRKPKKLENIRKSMKINNQ